ncbi:MAG: hypothetical protein GPJ52_08700, partial [Candidatus Heimdallarchaeota archaeon]|nr:hypothetical protein [Candidatus Heimdallarchaeota archaeon]
MNVEKFREHLAKNKMDEKKIEDYIGRLLEYQKYLEKQKQTIENVDVNELVNYTEILVKQDKDSVIEFLRALLNYAYYA